MLATIGELGEKLANEMVVCRLDSVATLVAGAKEGGFLLVVSSELQIVRSPVNGMLKCDPR